MKFHKGGKDGPTIATAETCQGHEGDTEVHLIPHHHPTNGHNHDHIEHTNLNNNPFSTYVPKTPSPLTAPSITPAAPSLSKTTIITLSHVCHHFPKSLHAKTSFAYNNKKYHWLGHTELIEESKGEVLARFEPTWFEGKGHKIGRLEVMEIGMPILGLVVVSALVVQERTDDHKKAVQLPIA